MRCLPPPPSRASADRNCLTRAPVDLALALFRTLCLVDGCKPSADTRRAPTKRLSAPCQIGETPLRRFAKYCACTHYLVFKEPDTTPDSAEPAVSLGCSPPTVAASVSRRRPFQGNLPRLLPSSWSVNPIRRAGEVGVRLTGLRVRRHATSGTPSQRSFRRGRLSAFPLPPGWRPSGELIEFTDRIYPCQDLS